MPHESFTRPLPLLMIATLLLIVVLIAAARLAPPPHVVTQTFAIPTPPTETITP